MNKAFIPMLGLLLAMISASVSASPRDLKEGLSGPDVKQWQTFLIGRGYLKPPALGNFAARTKKATIQFQRESGLTGTGVVSVRTLAKARKLGFKPGANPVFATTTKAAPAETKVPKGYRLVEYEIIPQGQFSVTYTNSQGGIEQITDARQNAKGEWSKKFFARPGTFLSVSAQNSEDYGVMFVDIYVNGKAVRSSKASGPYCIASCDVVLQ